MKCEALVERENEKKEQTAKRQIKDAANKEYLKREGKKEHLTSAHGIQMTVSA